MSAARCTEIFAILAAGLAGAAWSGAASAANFPLAPFHCAPEAAVEGGPALFTFQLGRGDGRGEVVLRPAEGSDLLAGEVRIAPATPSQLALPGDGSQLMFSLLGETATPQGLVGFWIGERVARDATILAFRLNLRLGDRELAARCAMPANESTGS